MLKELQEIFRDVFDDENLVITNELSADDIEDWDSLAHIRLIIIIEKHFNVKFKIDEIDKLKSVSDIIEILKSKI